MESPHWKYPATIPAQLICCFHTTLQKSFARGSSSFVGEQYGARSACFSSGNAIAINSRGENIVHKLLLFALLAVDIGTAQAEVVIKVRPPKVLVEHHNLRPSHNHVWISGYHR